MAIVTVIVRATSARGIALYQGATREYVDESTGEILEKEHWHWVAQKFVERIDGPQRGRPERVKLPDWLAQKEGLI
ncbi:hypothetical protein [Hyphomicrobium sp. MC8b]|uniref:hypothetical protein n=1 Tax=Hyphomicrobium sp. MC8b TaxID=300273 RepID=UPI00391CFE75